VINSPPLSISTILVNGPIQLSNERSKTAAFWPRPIDRSLVIPGPVPMPQGTRGGVPSNEIWTNPRCQFFTGRTQ
jgi:hypothetical protein